MSVPEHLLEALVAELADELAPRIAAELASRGAVPAIEEDGWRLLDVEEASARLGRSTRWLREKAKQGAVPFVRLDGGALAFELEDLQAFARRRRVSLDEGTEPLAGRLQAVGDPAARARSRGADRVGNRRVGP